jgi:NhaP-type Na+/H+ and K+/H+ antiporter
MPDSSSLSVGQALGRWILHMVVFMVSGGLAAGLSALAYEAIAQTQNPMGLYAVIFAAGGLIAYRLTERVLDSA